MTCYELFMEHVKASGVFIRRIRYKGRRDIALDGVRLVARFRDG